MADGYGIGNLDELGEGYGFRKIREPLGVTAFGVNAIVMPPGFEAPPHLHETQEELYFVHRGRMGIRFGDGEGDDHVLEEGGLARVDASTVRAIRNASDDEDLVVLIVGGKDGYVGRDGKRP
jgi:uncharacterized cupin superfamily protein